MPRVPPHGTEECRRRGLRRHGAPGLGLVPAEQQAAQRGIRPQRSGVQQVVQRVRGFARNVRVGASGAAGRRGIRPGFLRIFKDKTTKGKNTSAKTSIHLRRRHGCSLVAFDVLIESRFQLCPAGISWHGSDGGMAESTTCQHSTAARARLTEVQRHP